MNIWEMRRAYLNIRRLRQILTVLAKHGFSHFLEQMRIADHLPWVGRLIAESRARGAVSGEAGGGARDVHGMDLPARLAAAFEELGPVYVKLGQMLAVRPDLVPAEFRLAFSRLQDQIPAIPAGEITPEIEKALGKPVGEIFTDFNPAAVASGSIGQVHTAVLKSGREVIVKIKRPGIEKRIAEDSGLLAALAELADEFVPELAALRPKMLAAELSRTLRSEVDFVSEAARAAKFKQALEADGDAAVHIPDIFWDFARRDVLVMERVRGRALGDGEFLPPAERRRVAALVADCFMKQYFETGVFHADPHPGNILVQPGGAVSLIDFGQTGHLSEELRRTLGRMLMALKAGDTDGIVDIYMEIGEFAPDANIQGFRFDLANFLDRNYGMPADRMDFNEMAQESLSVARRNGLYLPRDFVLLVKSLMLVAGVVRGLDPAFRLDVAIAPAVRRLALKMYRPDVMARRGARTLSRFAGLLRRMPDDFRDIMDKARAGRFTITFRHDNLQGVAERTGRAVDRLTLGIIAAAIIVGSSIVLSAGQSGALSGYSIAVFGGVSVPVLLATLGFLLALALAAFVSWGIFRDKN